MDIAGLFVDVTHHRFLLLLMRWRNSSWPFSHEALVDVVVITLGFVPAYWVGSEHVRRSSWKFRRFD